MSTDCALQSPVSLVLDLRACVRDIACDIAMCIIYNENNALILITPINS